ncbi:MAG: transposase [Kouleothrix sp.]|nr:transposase [Kouleothrix sp.]
MAGRTDFITDARWEDVWTIWYTLVDDAYQTLEHHYGKWRRSGPTPIFSDSEVITVALIIDTWFGGHEALGLAFLRQYHPTLFPHLPSDGWFNQRRTTLGLLVDQVRRVISWHNGLLSDDDPVRLLDSASVPLATYTRGGENCTVSGSEDFGVASKGAGAKLFGLRLHVTTTIGQVVMIGCYSASLHDSTPMSAVFEQAHDLLVLGDGAFNNPTLEPVLGEKHRVEILAPPRKDSRKREPWSKAKRSWIGRMRRNIETAFSVLQTVFHIEQPQARSLAGVICRISTRLLAYNLCFLTGALLVQLRTN